jgi:hypothetical protein
MALIIDENPNAAQDAIRDLIAYSASVRWDTEQGGIVASNGIHIRTDSEAQRKIATLRGRVDRSEIPTPFNFKAFNGWQMIDQPNLAIIDADMGAHIRLCYEAERKLYDMIVNGAVTTEKQIDEYYKTFCFEPWDPMTIDRLIPDSYPVDGAAPFVLRVLGTNFCGLGRIIFNGVEIPTYLVSLTELRGMVETLPTGAVSVKVVHPGEIESNQMLLNITAPGSPPKPEPPPPAPAPVIAALTPNTARFDKVWAASINGSFLVSGAVVSIGVTPVTTTFVNAGQVTVSAPKSMFQTIGATFAVTVKNPDGLVSNPMTLTVVA